jgi:hypothetical protein
MLSLRSAHTCDDCVAPCVHSMHVLRVAHRTLSPGYIMRWLQAADNTVAFIPHTKRCADGTVSGWRTLQCNEQWRHWHVNLPWQSGSAQHLNALPGCRGQCSRPTSVTARRKRSACASSTCSDGASPGSGTWNRANCTRPFFVKARDTLLIALSLPPGSAGLCPTAWCAPQRSLKSACQQRIKHAQQPTCHACHSSTCRLPHRAHGSWKGVQ